MLVALLIPAGLSAAEIEIRLTADHSAVEVSGLSRELVARMSRVNAPGQWQQLFPVYVDAPNNPPPMLGTYRVQGDVLRFEPQFPLSQGLKYKAVFHSEKLPGAAAGAQAAPVVTGFQLPDRPRASATVVSHIYPTNEVVPENLLKFYVHFSAPMNRGGIYRHIHLRDGDGKEIELPFLELEEELWDPTMTRITLLFDPGRIKRGVMPLVDIGPALVEGKRFSLSIDRAWQDATGNPLKEDFQKRFTVGPADRQTIDPAKWVVSAPRTASRQPLSIGFGEALDQALATRLIQIVDDAGKRIEGETALTDREQQWTFTPASDWKSGQYKIVIATTIEDLAGNNIGKAFDVDVAQDKQRQLTSPSVSVPFEIR